MNVGVALAPCGDRPLLLSVKLWMMLVACTLPIPAGYFMPIFIYGEQMDWIENVTNTGLLSNIDFNMCAWIVLLQEQLWDVCSEKDWLM